MLCLWLILGFLASTMVSGFLAGLCPDLKEKEMKTVFLFLPVAILIFVFHNQPEFLGQLTIQFGD